MVHMFVILGHDRAVQYTEKIWNLGKAEIVLRGLRMLRTQISPRGSHIPMGREGPLFCRVVGLSVSLLARG